MQIDDFSSVAFRDVEPGKLFAFNKGKLTWGMRCVNQSDERRFRLGPGTFSKASGFKNPVAPCPIP